MRGGPGRRGTIFSSSGASWTAPDALFLRHHTSESAKSDVNPKNGSNPDTPGENRPDTPPGPVPDVEEEGAHPESRAGGAQGTDGADAARGHGSEGGPVHAADGAGAGE